MTITIGDKSTGLCVYLHYTNSYLSPLIGLRNKLEETMVELPLLPHEVMTVHPQFQIR